VRSELDHIAVRAPSLDEGAEYVRRALGVAPGPGGRHERMGTHNRLLRLGEKRYLEVIAIDPQAGDPGRKRWFALDGGVSAPQLITWVARTDDIGAAAWAGTPERMTRGALHWLITVSADGSMPMDGVAPTLIQWPDARHPADALPDLGCRLARLEGFHPQAAEIQAMLDRIGFAGPFRISSAKEKYLVAHIDTPAGPRRLESRTEVSHGSA